MYIAMLNEDERRCFLELAHHAVVADHEVVSAEQEILDSYKAECEMPEFAPSGKDITEILVQLRSARPDVHRIILMELYGIVLADDTLAKDEEAIIARIAEGLGISEPELRRMKRWSLDFINVVEDGFRLISSR